MNLVKTILPTKYGEFDMYAYTSEFKDFPHIVLVSKSWDSKTEPIVRIHSECMTGDLFASNRCDCGEQLNFSMKHISQKGGIILYLRQEGRGIGIVNKMKAYNLQDQGYDTVEANLKLGFHQDARDYSIVVEILKDLEVNSLKLMTNNPLKIKALIENGIKVTDRVPIQIEAHDGNRDYLQTKKNQMGHLLEDI